MLNKIKEVLEMEGMTMLQKTRLAVTQLLNSPNAVRTILILSALAIAAITGAAPNDLN